MLSWMDNVIFTGSGRRRSSLSITDQFAIGDDTTNLPAGSNDQMWQIGCFSNNSSRGQSLDFQQFADLPALGMWSPDADDALLPSADDQAAAMNAALIRHPLPILLPEPGATQAALRTIVLRRDDDCAPSTLSRGNGVSTRPEDEEEYSDMMNSMGSLKFKEVNKALQMTTIHAAVPVVSFSSFASSQTLPALVLSKDFEMEQTEANEALRKQEKDARLAQEGLGQVEAKRIFPSPVTLISEADFLSSVTLPKEAHRKAANRDAERKARQLKEEARHKQVKFNMAPVNAAHVQQALHSNPAVNIHAPKGVMRMHMSAKTQKQGKTQQQCLPSLPRLSGTASGNKKGKKREQKNSFSNSFGSEEISVLSNVPEVGSTAGRPGGRTGEQSRHVSRMAKKKVKKGSLTFSTKYNQLLNQDSKGDGNFLSIRGIRLDGTDTQKVKTNSVTDGLNLNSEPMKDSLSENLALFSQPSVSSAISPPVSDCWSGITAEPLECSGTAIDLCSSFLTCSSKAVSTAMSSPDSIDLSHTSFSPSDCDTGQYGGASSISSLSSPHYNIASRRGSPLEVSWGSPGNSLWTPPTSPREERQLERDMLDDDPADPADVMNHAAPLPAIPVATGQHSGEISTCASRPARRGYGGYGGYAYHDYPEDEGDNTEDGIEEFCQSPPVPEEKEGKRGGRKPKSPAKKQDPNPTQKKVGRGRFLPEVKTHIHMWMNDRALENKGEKDYPTPKEKEDLRAALLAKCKADVKDAQLNQYLTNFRRRYKLDETERQWFKIEPMKAKTATGHNKEQTKKPRDPPRRRQASAKHEQAYRVPADRARNRLVRAIPAIRTGMAGMAATAAHRKAEQRPATPTARSKPVLR